MEFHFLRQGLRLRCVLVVQFIRVFVCACVYVARAPAFETAFSYRLTNLAVVGVSRWV